MFLKGPVKRTAEDNQRFAESFEKMGGKANFICAVEFVKQRKNSKDKICEYFIENNAIW